jgi:Na+/proline symporter
MDDILRFMATVAIYFVIFAVVGIVFYQVDRRFKEWVARPRKPRR